MPCKIEILGFWGRKQATDDAWEERHGRDFCFAGEVGLSGEIRPVNRVEQRIQEAEKLGFATIFISKYNKISVKFPGIKVVLVSKIEEVVEQLFG